MCTYFVPVMMAQNEEIIGIIKSKKENMIGGTKEIVYNGIEHFAVIVADGVYKDIRYVCVNRGIHPAAYVFCPKEFLDSHKNDHDVIPGLYVHGGINYIGKASELLGLEDYDGYVFGWDYGHVGDWAGYISDDENRAFGNRKYTTRMVVDDCQDVIDQYLEILAEEKKIKDDNPFLTREILKELGFTSVFGELSGNDDAMQLSGTDDGKKWKIYIDFKSPHLSYALTQSPRRKYEGEITTLDELKEIAMVFKLPIDFKD